ncbi:MAG: LysR substrate-binding domain-containing protein [Paracoccaceae bacterium]|nr:LysR substrate-binding domain-containing protein [Paracoccaceae bacterium]
MDWLNIPSLSALRAFESCARYESLSGAAKALNVTHAAVSQHVRTLEARFGLALIERRGRGIGLTSEGVQLARGLSEGFGTIADTIAQMAERDEARPLTLSVTPTFAENWLMPRLGSFWAAHPKIALSIVPSRTVVDLRSDRVDVALRYGDGDWSGVHVSPLTTPSFVVVGRPSLFDGSLRASEAKQRRKPWFFEAGRSEYWYWARDMGLVGDDTPYTRLETNQLVISAVRSGYGLCVQARALVEQDVESGRLAIYCEDRETALRYHVVTMQPPEGRIKTFVDWVVREAAAR